MFSFYLYLSFQEDNSFSLSAFYALLSGEISNDYSLTLFLSLPSIRSSIRSYLSALLTSPPIFQNSNQLCILLQPSIFVYSLSPSPSPSRPASLSTSSNSEKESSSLMASSMFPLRKYSGSNLLCSNVQNRLRVQFIIFVLRSFTLSMLDILCFRYDAVSQPQQKSRFIFYIWSQRLCCNCCSKPWSFRFNRLYFYSLYFYQTILMVSRSLSPDLDLSASLEPKLSRLCPTLLSISPCARNSGLLLNSLQSCLIRLIFCSTGKFLTSSSICTCLPSDQASIYTSGTRSQVFFFFVGWLFRDFSYMASLLNRFTYVETYLRSVSVLAWKTLPSIIRQSWMGSSLLFIFRFFLTFSGPFLVLFGLCVDRDYIFICDFSSGDEGRLDVCDLLFISTFKFHGYIFILYQTAIPWKKAYMANNFTRFSSIYICHYNRITYQFALGRTEINLTWIIILPEQIAPPQVYKKQNKITMKPKNKKGQASEQSQPENDNKSDKSQNTNEEVDTDNSPKIIPVAKLPDKLRTKKIVINISDTQYPIIEEIAEEMGWTVEREEGLGDWDLWWTDREITPDTLFKMNLHQKINHFPGIYVLARKNMLGLNLMAMRDRFESEYDFFPETWVIPLQFAKFRAFYESVDKGKARTYIVKPQALSQGRGIFLTRNIEDIMNGNKYVVQRYLKNPLLIDDLKFDLRIYVLLAGTDPLRLYLYEQGLTRFATRKYEQPTEQNLNQPFIHLTNYSLNKKNPEYIYNTSDQDTNTGHKRSLSSTYDYLAKKGYNVQKLKQQIEAVIIKTIIAGLPAISHQYQYCQPEEYENNMCFHILGVDVMIDTELKPYIIEINHTPSFETGTPLDYKVKKNLIIDTLKIMRVTSKNKKSLFEKAKELVKRRIETGKREIVKGDRRHQMLVQAQEKRDREEAGLLGGFKKIFPIPDNPEMMEEYEKMISHAEQVHKETEQTRRKLIRDEQQKMKAKKRSCSQADNGKDHNKEHHSNGNSKDQKELKDLKLHKNISYNPKPQKQRELANIEVPLVQLHKQTQSQKHIEQALTHPAVHPSQQPFTATALHYQIERTHITSSKNCNFRTKTKRNVYNPKQQFIKFSEFMINYIASQNSKRDGLVGAGGLGASQGDQEAFYKIKKVADKRRKELASSEKEKNKEGAYIIPKMYEIIDSKAAIRIEAELVKKINRDKQAASPQVSESQKLVKPINSYKGMYKKKRFSIY